MNQMLVFLLLIVVASGKDTHPSCFDGCFFDSPESCPGPHEPFRCTISPTCSKAVVCCNLTNDNILDELRNVSNGSKSHYRALHIMQSNFDSFNLSMTQWWRVLQSFAVTNGAIRSFDTVFPKHSKQLSCLNLTSNGIVELRNDSVKLCSNLSVLDVSLNKLKMLPAFASNQNITLDISNNSLQCDTLQTTLKNKPNLDFINANRTWCAQPDNNTWYNYSVYLKLTQIERINEIERVCPKNCTCKVHRLDVSPGNRLQSSVSFAINCAEQQLTSLPSPLPDRTIALNVSVNNVPTYMFMNTFDRNNNIRMVRLGQNKLKCDCDTAKIFKVWLGMEKLIEDSEEIFCEDTGKQVLSLDAAEMCHDELADNKQFWIDSIYYIIAAEVALLTILIAKVSYDYWVFKTKGYLPWPASKMPKLPCDWLCE